MSSLPKVSFKPRFFSDLSQVGIVVNDLHRSVRWYWELFGIGPWSIYRYEPPYLTDMWIRGKQCNFSMRVALAWCGPLMLELIEPIEGDSIYKEFLSNRSGVHHIASYSVSDAPAALRELNSAGIRALQSSRFVKGGFSVSFTYLDTEEKLGTIIELIDPKGTRSPPDETFP